MSDSITVEVCVENRAGALAALQAGAQRVELCAALDLGGVTPSAGEIESALEVGIETVVLIRPRAGDFVYDADEVRVMRRDMERAWDMGVRSFAIGALTPTGDLDRAALSALTEVGRGTPEDPGTLCCHRAFDGTRDPRAALELLVELGFARLL
ncbi:MAG: copper homeostasis protein CutC, partial [Planctomycetes bacterium]|nr:copper homeostasis protein CutC [Planctomycetota bacterium]